MRATRSLVLAAASALLASSCGENADAPLFGDTPAPQAPASDEPATAAGSSDTTPQAPRVNEGEAPAPLVGSSGAEGSSGTASPPTGGIGMPCEVASIIEERCSMCHGETPQFNAPMALVEAGDFTAPAPISGGPVNEAVLRRIDAAAARPMPPAGTVEPLTDAERSTLQAWLELGAAPVADGCSVGALNPDDLLGPLPAPPESGAGLEPYEGWDSGDVECFPLVANSGDLTTPYRVGTATDEYVGFGFSPPWGEGTRYVRAFRTVIDNAQVLHHWLLFQQDGAVQNGSVTPQLGAHPDGQLLHGWAPGGDDAYYSTEVGVELEAGRGYLLELHYNSSDPNAVDASGVEVCVTETKPQNVALLSWLGTDAISGTSSSGTCRPRATEPIHIISGSPHMHLNGRHMTVTVNRADGTSEIVHDEPFDFENQRMYAEDITIFPGDTITTTCEYSAPSRFGKGTNEEMCYWFAQSYPAGALADGAFLGTLIHGQNSCLGL